MAEHNQKQKGLNQKKDAGHQMPERSHKEEQNMGGHRLGEDARRDRQWDEMGSIRRKSDGDSNKEYTRH